MKTKDIIEKYVEFAEFNWLKLHWIAWERTWVEEYLRLITSRLFLESIANWLIKNWEHKSDILGHWIILWNDDFVDFTNHISSKQAIAISYKELWNFIIKVLNLWNH